MGKQDGLSEIICKKCVARLRVAYEFKKQAESSDRHLRSFISDVNRKFKQVTGSTTNNSPNKNKKWIKETNSSDELEDDIEALLNDEEGAYSSYGTDRSVDDKKTIPREQLVEILGESSSNVRKTSGKQTNNYIEEAAYDEPQEMEIFLVDERDVEDGCIVEGMESDEYDEIASELTNDETEPQYLDYDVNEEMNPGVVISD